MEHGKMESGVMWDVRNYGSEGVSGKPKPRNRDQPYNYHMMIIRS